MKKHTLYTSMYLRQCSYKQYINFQMVACYPIFVQTFIHGSLQRSWHLSFLCALLVIFIWTVTACTWCSMKMINIFQWNGECTPTAQDAHSFLARNVVLKSKGALTDLCTVTVSTKGKQIDIASYSTEQRVSVALAELYRQCYDLTQH